MGPSPGSDTPLGSTSDRSTGLPATAVFRTSALLLPVRGWLLPAACFPMQLRKHLLTTSGTSLTLFLIVLGSFWSNDTILGFRKALRHEVNSLWICALSFSLLYRQITHRSDTRSHLSPAPTHLPTTWVPFKAH